MLENIKLALDISLDKYDTKINYYIRKVTQKVLIYCNLNEKEMNEELEVLIEDKVISIMSTILANEGVDTGDSGAINQELLKNQGAIKSISRGDTTITYNYDSISTSSSASSGDTDNLLDFTTNEKNLLNKFRKLRK